MGSFCSTQKNDHTDHQDNDYRIPKNISRSHLLELCQYEKLHQYGLQRNILKVNTNTFNDSINQIDNSFSVLQWNLLSQTLGRYCDKFVKCPAEVLNWAYRKYSIIEELIINSPDIMCLQEVDHFKFLKMVLGTQGYTGYFFPKPDSLCLYMEDNNGPDGCAIFFNHDIFRFVSVHTRVLNVWNVNSNQVAIAMILCHMPTKKEVCVVTTHLKARNGALLSWIRNAQARDLVTFTKEVSQGRPVVICGDFNGDPSEPFYNTMCTFQDIGLESSYSKFRKLVNNWNSQNVNQPHEYDYTTWTVRDSGETSRTIDYIFFSPETLEVEGIAEIPSPESIGVDRLPSKEFPSDHLSLTTEFKFRNC